MPKQNTAQQSRRRLLKTLTGTGSLFLGSKALPEQWTKPIVDSVILPAHAQASPPPPPTPTPTPTPENPAIDIEKSTNGVDADQPPGPTLVAGDPVTWEYFVSNIGDVPLTSVSVVDDQGVMITCPLSTLAPGQTMICTGTGVVTSGQYENFATAQGTSPLGTTVTDVDPSHYSGIAE